MENNLVIFGPAHAGKSTLGGYMITKLTPNFDFNKFISDIQKQLCSNYDKAQKFAYILDKAIDERLRTARPGLGTSKYIHFDKITINEKEVTIIDTPGAEHKYRERIKGMYFGEVGMFIIEGQNLVKSGLLSKEGFETLQDVFTPLFMWLKSLAKKYLVIVISKIDSIDFSEERFNEAVRIIKTVCHDETIEVIPISIDVEREQDHNIFSKSEKMLWYSGHTLFEKLQTIVEEIPYNKIENPFFMNVEKQFNKPFGLFLRGKILQGSLKNKSKIIITPIFYKNKEYTTISAEVENIRREKGDDIEIAESGSIVGIRIHDIRTNDRRCEKEDFDTIDTSCIINPGYRIAMGNVLRFKVSSDEIEKFNILETIMILWFGKFIASRVIYKAKGGNQGDIILEIENMQASLPLDNNGNYFFKNFLLKREGKFIPANLENLGIPKILTVFVKNIHNRMEFIKKYYENFEYEVFPDSLRFHCDYSFIDLVSKIKIKRFDESNEESENVLSIINVELLELIEK